MIDFVRGESFSGSVDRPGSDPARSGVTLQWDISPQEGDGEVLQMSVMDGWVKDIASRDGVQEWNWYALLRLNNTVKDGEERFLKSCSWGIQYHDYDVAASKPFHFRESDTSKSRVPKLTSPKNQKKFTLSPDGTNSIRFTYPNPAQPHTWFVDCRKNQDRPLPVRSLGQPPAPDRSGGEAPLQFIQNFELVSAFSGSSSQPPLPPNSGGPLSLAEIAEQGFLYNNDNGVNQWFITDSGDQVELSFNIADGKLDDLGSVRGWSWLDVLRTSGSLEDDGYTQTCSWGIRFHETPEGASEPPIAKAEFVLYLPVYKSLAPDAPIGSQTVVPESFSWRTAAPRAQIVGDVSREVAGVDPIQMEFKLWKQDSPQNVLHENKNIPGQPGKTSYEYTYPGRPQLKIGTRYCWQVNVTGTDEPSQEACFKTEVRAPRLITTPSDGYVCGVGNEDVHDNFVYFMAAEAGPAIHMLWQDCRKGTVYARRSITSGDIDSTGRQPNKKNVRRMQRGVKFLSKQNGTSKYTLEDMIGGECNAGIDSLTIDPETGRPRYQTITREYVPVLNCEECSENENPDHRRLCREEEEEDVEDFDCGAPISIQDGDYRPFEGRIDMKNTNGYVHYAFVAYDVPDSLTFFDGTGNIIGNTIVAGRNLNGIYGYSGNFEYNSSERGSLYIKVTPNKKILTTKWKLIVGCGERNVDQSYRGSFDTLSEDQFF